MNQVVDKISDRLKELFSPETLLLASKFHFEKTAIFWIIIVKTIILIIMIVVGYKRDRQDDPKYKKE